MPHEKFHNPRITPSTRKVCVGGWVVFEGKFSVSFGPNLEPGILALGLDQAEQYKTDILLAKVSLNFDRV